jgi:hypothetical protein
MHCNHHPKAGLLRKLGRMAIWNREKIVILIAIGVWVTDVAFLIIGECSLLSMGVFLTSPVRSQAAYG